MLFVYPLLSDRLLLRHLEVPLLYDISNEDMWELDEEALNALQYFTGTWSLEDIANKIQVKDSDIFELIETLGPDLIEDKHLERSPITFDVQSSPIPSLRTILIHTTLACNLKCRHCYLGEMEKKFIDSGLFHSVISQLHELQGLKVLISGGEPLLHPNIFGMLESIKKFKLRKMLLSNGMLIDTEIARRLKTLVHEVQISVDGTDSHNSFRNNSNAFEKAIQAIKTLLGAGLDVSVATMIHSQNLEELPALEAILKELGVKSWALDVPSQTGEFLKYPDLYPSIQDAGAALREYGWGAPFEETHNIYACGAHLCALMPNGDISKCGFFTDRPVGNLNQMSLKDCWKAIQKDFIWEQKELECAKLNCPYLENCRGGCRFRASVGTGQLFGVDRVKCAVFNFEYPKKE